MEVKVVEGLNFDSWDKFVEESNNGTIFHKLKFLTYHPEGRFNFFNLTFYKKKTLIAVLPGALQHGIFKSPAGASYGSFVTGDISFEDYEELIDTFLKFARKSNIKKIYLTPPPIIYMESPNEIERYMLIYKGFKVKHHLISNALHLKDLETSNLMEKFTPMFKRGIRKSFKEKVAVDFNEDYDNFYPILVDNKKKFKTLPTHSFEEILKIKKLFPKDVYLLMAYNQHKKPVAGLWFICCNNNVVLTFYISHYYQYQHLRQVNRLLCEAAGWAKEKKYQWLDLGVSMDTFSKNPMEPSRSLIFFKEGLHSRGFVRTTYSLEI